MMIWHQYCILKGKASPSGHYRTCICTKVQKSSQNSQKSEQGTHKPFVEGSTPSLATLNLDLFY